MCSRKASEYTPPVERVENAAMHLAGIVARAHAKGWFDPPREVTAAIAAYREATERVSHRNRCPFGTCPSCDDTIEVGDHVVLLSKSWVGVVLATNGPYLWVNPLNPGEHPRSWMAEGCARVAAPPDGTYWLTDKIAGGGEATTDNTFAAAATHQGTTNSSVGSGCDGALGAGVAGTATSGGVQTRPAPKDARKETP